MSKVNQRNLTKGMTNSQTTKDEDKDKDKDKDNDEDEDEQTYIRQSYRNAMV